MTYTLIVVFITLYESLSGAVAITSQQVGKYSSLESCQSAGEELVAATHSGKTLGDDWSFTHREYHCVRTE
jgi:hypothetical protein